MAQLWSARGALSAFVLAGPLISFPLDWAPNHLLNPLWHDHARFHGALLLFYFLGASLASLYLLWHPRVPVRPAAVGAFAGMASFWAPLFWIPYVLPGATAWASDPSRIPSLGGVRYYPNLVVAGLFLAGGALALGFVLRGVREK